MELCISCWVERSLMGVTTLLFSRAEMKKIMSLTSLEEKLRYGIKGWNILEKRVFNHYKVKVWLKVCLTVTHISISVNIVYMENRIELNSLLVLQGQKRLCS